MIEVLLVTHGQLGRELKKTADMISGHTDGAETISFLPGQGVEDLERTIKSTLSGIDTKDGVLCLVDMPGGSPARVAASIALDNDMVQVVSGVNLAMLVEALLIRNTMDIYQLAKHVEQSAHESIMNIGEVFRKELKKEC